MGGPNPGIVANFVVEHIKGDSLTYRVPRYCALNPDQTIYFVAGEKYAAHIMPEDQNRTGIDLNLRVETVTDLGTEYDLVRVTAEVLAGLGGWFHEGEQYGALFIARLPVPAEPETTG